MFTAALSTASSVVDPARASRLLPGDAGAGAGRGVAWLVPGCVAGRGSDVRRGGIIWPMALAADDPACRIPRPAQRQYAPC